MAIERWRPSVSVERGDPYGRRERSVQRPMPVQSEKVKVTHRDGVLEARLPKAEEVKPKAITIDVV